MANIAKSRQVPENNIILYQDENGITHYSQTHQADRVIIKQIQAQ